MIPIRLVRFVVILPICALGYQNSKICFSLLIFFSCSKLIFNLFFIFFFFFQRIFLSFFPDKQSKSPHFLDYFKKDKYSKNPYQNVTTSQKSNLDYLYNDIAYDDYFYDDYNFLPIKKSSKTTKKPGFWSVFKTRNPFKGIYDLLTTII